MKTRILVVDDEKEIRDLLSRHFRYLGYEVETAENGAVALQRLAASRFTIVISDIMMPEMNGVDLLAAVRRDYPLIRVIMITGYVTQRNILECMQRGAETCVFKPLRDLTQLEQAVERTVAVIAHWMEILAELRGLKSTEASKRA